MSDKVNDYSHTYITDHNFYQIEVGLDRVYLKWWRIKLPDDMWGPHPTLVIFNSFDQAKILADKLIKIDNGSVI